MKREDLKIGEAYLYDRSNDWATPGYGDGLGKRAVVIGLWWHRARNEWGFRDKDREVPVGTKGAGVLVEVTNWNGGTERIVVPPAHLRGPYEATAAKVKEWTVQRDASNAAADRERRAAATFAAEVRLSAKALGVDVYSSTGEHMLKVPTAVFAAMVAALAEAGWRYDPQAANGDLIVE